MEKESIGTEGQRHTVTWAFTRDATRDRLGAVTLSTQADAPVLLYGYEDGDGYARTFDPPVAMSSDDDTMAEGEEVTTRTTDSDGQEWNVSVSYSDTLAQCPTTYSNDWYNCPVFRVQTDAAAPPLFEGSWVMVATFGPVQLALSGPPGELEAWWSLSDFDYTP